MQLIYIYSVLFLCQMKIEKQKKNRKNYQQNQLYPFE